MNITIDQDIESGVQTVGPFPVVESTISSYGRNGMTTTVTIGEVYGHPLTLGVFQLETTPRMSDKAAKRLERFKSVLNRQIQADPEVLTRECERITFQFLKEPGDPAIIECVELQWRQTDWEQRLDLRPSKPPTRISGAMCENG